MRSVIAILIGAVLLLSACGTNSSGPGTVTITCADLEASGTASKCASGSAAMAIGDPPMQGGTVSASGGFMAISGTLHLTGSRNVVTLFVVDTSCDNSLTPEYWLAIATRGPLGAGDHPLDASTTCQGIQGMRLMYAASYDADLLPPDSPIFTTIPTTWTPGADPAALLDQVSVQFNMTP